jgi:hypothetical protein
MGGECGTHGRNEKWINNFGRKTWREENSEDLGVDGRIIYRNSGNDNKFSGSMQGGEFLD